MIGNGQARDDEGRVSGRLRIDRAQTAAKETGKGGVGGTSETSEVEPAECGTYWSRLEYRK